MEEDGALYKENIELNEDINNDLFQKNTEKNTYHVLDEINIKENAKQGL